MDVLRKTVPWLHTYAACGPHRRAINTRGFIQNREPRNASLVAAECSPSSISCSALTPSQNWTLLHCLCASLYTVPLPLPLLPCASACASAVLCLSSSHTLPLFACVALLCSRDKQRLKMKGSQYNKNHQIHVSDIMISWNKQFSVNFPLTDPLASWVYR